MTTCRMPMSRASSFASASSDRGTLGLSAVTATARLPRARNAALATTVLSLPPLNATATPGSPPRTARSRSRFAASSDVSSGSAIQEVYQSRVSPTRQRGPTPRPRWRVGLTSLLRLRRHDEHRARGVADDLLGDAAEQ